MTSARWFAALAALWLASAAVQAKIHQRGEFSFRVEPTPEFVELQTVPDAWTRGAPGEVSERWRNWLLDLQVDRRAAVPVTYTDHAYEASSSELVGQAARVMVEFNPAYEQLVLHRVELRRDGAWGSRLDPAKVTLARREQDFENDLSQGTVSALLVLEDVRAGDVIRVAYSLHGRNPVLAGSDHDQALLGWIDPILHRRVRFLFPAGSRVVVHRSDGAPPLPRPVPGGVEVRLDLHGVAAGPDEGGYPVWYDPHPLLQAAEQRQWRDVQEWAQALYPEPGPLPADLEARVVQWQALPSPVDRLGAVLEAMQEEVRYFGIELGENSHRPRDPAETWTRRFGDCKDKAHLMATVLRRLGIDASPALVSHRRGRAVADSPPAASQFDHVIVRARIGDQEFWLDPTLTQQTGDPRRLVSGDYGVALPVDGSGSGLVPVTLPKDTGNRQHVVESYRLQADGKSAEVTISTTLGGTAAERMRRTVASRGVEELGRQYADFYTRRFGRVETLQPVSVQEVPGGGALTVVERYRLPSALAPAAGNNLALEVHADAIDGDLTRLPSQSRAAPLALPYPMTYQHDVVVELPTGWQWAGDPEDVEIRTKTFTYSRRFAQSGSTVTLSQSGAALADHVPREGLGDHLEKMHAVGDGLGRRFLLRPPSELRAGSRDKRLQDLLRDVIND